MDDFRLCAVLSGHGSCVSIFLCSIGKWFDFSEQTGRGKVEKRERHSFVKDFFVEQEKNNNAILGELEFYSLFLFYFNPTEQARCVSVTSEGVIISGSYDRTVRFWAPNEANETQVKEIVNFFFCWAMLEKEETILKKKIKKKLKKASRFMVLGDSSIIWSRRCSVFSLHHWRERANRHWLCWQKDSCFWYARNISPGDHNSLLTFPLLLCFCWLSIQILRS